MKMKANYQNRGGDTIVFNQIDDNTVEMTGYRTDLGLRSGFENDYTDAYEEYVLSVGRVIDEPVLGIDYVCFENFKEEIHTDEHLKPFRNLIKSTNNRYFIDVSSGPWISKGMDLNLFYNDGIDRIVTSISTDVDKIIFKINE